MHLNLRSDSFSSSGCSQRLGLDRRVLGARGFGQSEMRQIPRAGASPMSNPRRWEQKRRRRGKRDQRSSHVSPASVSPLCMGGGGSSVIYRIVTQAGSRRRRGEGGPSFPAPMSTIGGPFPSVPPSPPTPSRPPACCAVISLGSFRIGLATPHPWNLEA